MPYFVPKQFPCTLDARTGRFAFASESKSYMKYTIEMYDSGKHIVLLDFITSVPLALLFVGKYLLVSTSGNMLYTIDLHVAHVMVQQSIMPGERVGISNFFYNTPRGWIIVDGRDGGWSLWRDTEPFMSTTFERCHILTRGDHVSFSEDGSRAICTKRFSEMVYVCDADTGHMINTIRLPFTQLWGIKEIKRDVYAVHNVGRVTVMKNDQVVLESNEWPLLGPEVIAVDHRSQTVFVREWSTRGTVVSFFFWLEPTRAAFLRSCVL